PPFSTRSAATPAIHFAASSTAWCSRSWTGSAATAHAERIDGLKRDLLARPELAELARNIWANARSFVERSASGETQVLQQHLTGMFVKAGEALAADSELRAEINRGLVAVLTSFIADQ